MVSDKPLSFPEVDISASNPLPYPPRSGSATGSLNDVLSSKVCLLPPSDSSVHSSPSFEDLQSWQGGGDSDDSIESEKRDIFPMTEGYHNTGSLRRRRKEYQNRQDSGSLSSGSFEESRPNTLAVKSKVDRRKSDTNACFSEKRAVRGRTSSVGSQEDTGELTATLTRRDKTTGVYMTGCEFIVLLCSVDGFNDHYLLHW